MEKVKLIITGSTGLVGEGVLLECLNHPSVERVLALSRKPVGRSHPKLKELIVSDFLKLEDCAKELEGYDACLYCAGISSRGLTEEEYSHITFDIALHVAKVVLQANPESVFSHVSGSHTDGTEKGRMMWARVKGKTENALIQLPFKKVYNFRPGFMKPTKGQRNVKSYYKTIDRLTPVLKLFFPGQICTMKEVGLAMINSVLLGYDKPILEIKDIKKLAAF